MPPPAGILFVSGACRHCNDLLNSMQRLPQEVWQHVQLFCIDGRLDMVPSNVDRVPALIVPSKNAVLFGANLMQEVVAIAERAAGQNGGGGGPSPNQHTEEVQPFRDLSSYDFQGLVGEPIQDEGAALFENPLEGGSDPRRMQQPATQAPHHQHQQNPRDDNGMEPPKDTRRAPQDASALINQLVGQREKDIRIQPGGPGPAPPVDTQVPRDIYAPYSAGQASQPMARPHFLPAGNGGGWGNHHVGFR